jgi:hypothetical protein
MSYNDDAKMKLLKEAWAKMEEGEVTNPNTTGKIISTAKTSPAPKGLDGTKVSGTGVNQNPRAKIATATAGAENLAEEEEAPEGMEDTGAPASAEDIGAGDAGAVDAGAAMGGMDPMGGSAVGAEGGSAWDKLVSAVEQMKAALQEIAAEESGEPEHGGAGVGGEDLGAEGDAEIGGEEPPIDEVASGYLEEAKKKLKEKCATGKACGANKGINKGVPTKQAQPKAK